MPSLTLIRPPNQAAALPIRLHAEGFVEVMLVTSRKSGRWIIPKGWMEAGLAPHEVAAKKAEEEAGLIGRVDPECFGTFTYEKRPTSGTTIRCDVVVYLLRVEEQLARWREQGERQYRWLPSREASRLICNIALQRLVQKIGRQPELLRTRVKRHRVAAPSEVGATKF